MFDKIKTQLITTLGENKQFSVPTIERVAKLFSDLATELNIDEDTIMNSKVIKEDITDFFNKDFQLNINRIAKEAVESYKVDNPIVKIEPLTPTPAPIVPPIVPQDGTLSPEVKEALEYVRAEKANRAKVEKQTSIINKLIDPTIGMPKEDAQDYVSLISISDNTDIDSETTKIMALYNKRIASIGGNTTPKGAGGIVTDKSIDEDVADIIARKQNK